MLEVGILYAIVAAIGILIDLIIVNRTKATEYKDTIDRPFCIMLDFFLVFLVVDMIWGLYTSQWLFVSKTGYEIFTYAFHICASVSAFVWAGYAIYYMGISGMERHILNICRSIFLTIQIAVVFSNIWTHKMFIITDDAQYVAYDLRKLMFYLQFAYYFVLFVYAFIKLFDRNSKQTKKIYITAIVFSCIPFVFGIAQMSIPFGPMYSLGFIVASIAIYSFNITSQREVFLTRFLRAENDKLISMVYGLSQDFQTVYYVDMNTNAYEKYVNKDVKEGGLGFSVMEKGDDFFTDRFEDIEPLVYEDDHDISRESLDKEHIINELKDKASFRFNCRMNINDKVMYYMIKVTKSQINEGENRILVGLFNDDARVHAENERRNELKKAYDLAEAGNKAKSDFMFSMSHDIRTPLNAIIGFTGLAKKHLNQKDYMEDYLEKISSAGNHLLSLINDVLDMSRIESGKLEIDIKPEDFTKNNEQLAGIVLELASMKSITFNTEYVGMRDRYIRYDRVRLNQVLLNILSNAVKYTKIGGKVLYRTEQLEDKGDKATFRFTVQDDGIGMSREFLSHIFDEFAREKTSTVSGVEGTGLGMAIVKRLVDIMGGELEIESEQGVGTTVKCVLSFEKAAQNDVEFDDDNEEKDILEIVDKHILLVDDNTLNREIARDILEEDGAFVDEAGDGDEAVSMIEKSEAGHYDVVLMDVQMPRVDGYTATKQIRQMKDKAKAEIPIIALTANAFEQDKKNALEAGMNAHLSKPIRVNELEKVLARVLQRGD